MNICSMDLLRKPLTTLKLIKSSYPKAEFTCRPYDLVPPLLQPIQQIFFLGKKNIG